MKIRYVVLSLAAIFASTGCTAQSAIQANPAGSQFVQTDHSPTTQPMLNGLLNQLRSQVTPEQYQAFSQAVESSPPLSDQLNSLIEKGLLQRITIVDAPQDNWRAWRDGSKWVFVAGFVHDLTPHRLYDVVRKDDILPDNIAFVLGYLAWHTAHAEQLERATQT